MENRLEIYRQPEGSIYTSVQIVTPPRSIDLPGFAQIAIDVNDLFPVQKD